MDVSKPLPFFGKKAYDPSVKFSPAAQNAAGLR
jgi:hypothetical protein